jgi:hypothetical protein
MAYIVVARAVFMLGVRLATLLVLCTNFRSISAGSSELDRLSRDFLYRINLYGVVRGKPIHFWDSRLNPYVLMPSLYHSVWLDMFPNFYTLLTGLIARISCGLEGFQSVNLSESAQWQVTSAANDNCSLAVS